MATGISVLEIPDSTVKSSVGASFIVPSDRYGVARAHVQDGETFLIDTVTVLSSRPLDILGANVAITSTAGISYGVGASRVFYGQMYSTSAASVPNIGGTITAQAANPANNSNLTYAGPSQTLNLAATGPSTGKGITGFEIGAQNTAAFQTFRLPPGSVISGGRYHLELYKIPGSET